MPEDLAEIIAAWPSLSSDLHAHILAHVREAAAARKST
jgi:hypothetical protein